MGVLNKSNYKLYVSKGNINNKKKRKIFFINSF